MIQPLILQGSSELINKAYTSYRFSTMQPPVGRWTSYRYGIDTGDELLYSPYIEFFIKSEYGITALVYIKENDIGEVNQFSYVIIPETDDDYIKLMVYYYD